MMLYDNVCLSFPEVGLWVVVVVAGRWCESACGGDDGSPVIKRISDTSGGKPYFEQHYIACFQCIDSYIRTAILINFDHTCSIFAISFLI